MKREEFIPIALGFSAQASPRWLAEEDTIENHVDNWIRNQKDHRDVLIQVLKTNDGKGE